MRKLFIFILSLSIVSCFGQQKTISEQKFTKKYFEAVSEKYPRVSYKIIENLVVNATFGENGEITHYLDNAYRAYKLDPTELDKVLALYLDTNADLYKEQEEINVNRIVPIVKPLNYLDDLKSLGNNVKDYEFPTVLWEKYNEDLIIVYAEDKEKTISYFNQEDFEKLKINRDTLLQFSIKNLSNILPKIEKLGENGNFMLTAGGEYEVSLILMSAIWTKENFDVDGDIVIVIPNRDLVLITGSNDKVSIEKLKVTVTESYQSGNYNISESFYKWNGTKFIKL